MTADAILRASMANMPIPALPEPSFTTPPPLRTARVAVVTTGGFMRHGESPWTHDETSFRVFGRDEPVVLGHVSMSFDRSGAMIDRNVAVPLSRLDELVSDGVIASVCERYISFMGALRADELLRTLMLDTGPAAARLLRDDGVDVVLLTPMCPGCARTITLLGHVLEAEGLATVVLASNAAITERVRPPRALLCDFPLGRPLGRPLDPAFQRRVLEAAFALLERPEGPVLERFPESIDDESDVPMTCALPPRYDPAVPAPIDEARALRPAWERTRAKHGVTHVGLRIDADGVPSAIDLFVQLADRRPWSDLFETSDQLFQTAMDVRVYYEEAALGLADHVPAARSSEAWFYQRTETGRLFREVVRVLRETGQEAGLGIAGSFYLVPLSQSDGDRAKPPWQTNR